MGLEAIVEIIGEYLARAKSDPDVPSEAAHEAFEDFLGLLERGEVRAAFCGGDGVWRADARVKQAILYGFRLGHLVESTGEEFQFCDKHNLWPASRGLARRGIRVVPGGTTVRRGAYLGNGVTVMPPSYVNIGAHVGAGTMLDSHVLVGSCAQVGERCHISTAVQIGGVLEPVGALPVVIEDGVFVGGGCGIYEGAHIHAGAVLGASVVITRSTPIFDLVHEKVIGADGLGVVHIPENAVVVPGVRGLSSQFALAHGLGVYAPVIVKYRDGKTSAATALESALR